MNRFLHRGLVTKSTFDSLQKSLKGFRCVTTQSSKSDNLFPERVDFPSRHIGPRDQDVVTMLDLLGYKVCNLICRYSFRGYPDLIPGEGMINKILIYHVK